MQQFIIFALIGFVNAILNVIVWKTLVILICNYSAFVSPRIFKHRYVIAHTFSFAITVITSYIPNKIYAFNAGNTQDNSQFVKFMMVAIFSWLVTTFFIHHFTGKDYMDKYMIKWKYYDISIKVLSILLSMVTNFLGYKFLVF
jgi:putative flippase GtrA